MPQTAKLSRRFYERLGDEVANELVDLLNQVDASYKSDLKEINEINWARFEARLDQRIAELEARVDSRLADLRVSLEKGLKDQTRFLFAAWAALLAAIIPLYFK